MGTALATCKKLLLEDAEHLQGRGSDGYYTYSNGPQLRLRVDWNPIRESLGARCCPFSLTDEIVVEALDVRAPRGWEPLSWRHEHYLKERNANKENQQSKPTMPSGPRYSVPKRYTRARIGRAWYLLQVAVAPEDRTMEHVKADIIDSKDAAAYAHHFNAHLRRSAGHDDFEQTETVDNSVPIVQVCAPIGCCVLETAIPQLAGSRAGEVVTLAPYPSMEVNKFVFDGQQEFLELPQAFFHFVTWLSGGKEMVYDLQGFEGDEGEVLLIDPCVLRPPKVGVKEFLNPLSSEKSATMDVGPSPERFDQLHRRCGPLCQTFDPERRGPRGRKMCGLDVKCGMPQ
mmetsp:Transcript_14280/g.32419  ORF Transcript_14280/g.32419 Transcript_14280/m.32419 type:complete len:342 (-) Transcript_14280:88-1113(-)